jgi:hypothetical protein
MAAGDLSRRKARKEIAAVNKEIRRGTPAHVKPGNNTIAGAVTKAALALGENRKSLLARIGTPNSPGTWKRMYKLEPDWGYKSKAEKAQAKRRAVELELLAPFIIEHEAPRIGSSRSRRWELVSRKDNTFCFGAFGDLHAASRYCRVDVRQDLTKRAEALGAQCIFDTGNWIDGEARFNRYDIECSGLDNQCRKLAEIYPKSKLPTYAVAGADHEGWYVKSEGVDVGRYCEAVMRDAGHPWTNLGYMQADVVLTNYNTKKTSILRVMHPGGGTGYALSYRPQKIIEAMEGGEKPAVLLLGHYHKIDCGLVRNVWYVQTGTGQDQTPFMAQKAIEAHVGGFVIECEQDPKTGAIIEFTPHARRYFNRNYYFETGKANNRWSGHGPVSQVPRRANQA